MNRRRFLMNMGMGIALVAMTGCAAYVPTKRGVIQMGGDSSIVGEILNGMFAPTPHQIREAQKRTLPAAVFEKVDCKHNVPGEGGMGAIITSDIFFRNLMYTEIRFGAFIFRKNAGKLMTDNNRYKGGDGQVVFEGERVVPYSNPAIIRNYSIFMPYAPIFEAGGKGDYWFYIDAIDAQSRDLLGRSKNIYLTLN